MAVDVTVHASRDKSRGRPIEDHISTRSPAFSLDLPAGAPRWEPRREGRSTGLARKAEIFQTVVLKNNVDTLAVTRSPCCNLGRAESWAPKG